MTARRKAGTRGRASPKVFISHASTNRDLARRVATLLRRNGIDYWFSREHIARGSDWYRAIGDALEWCNCPVVIATRVAVRNKWVQEEVTYALIERRYRNQVIPLLFETCRLERLAWSLKNKQHIDFRDRRTEAGKELIARLR
jgi:hypothetical protein